jgi:hypothetical protein
MLRRDAGTFMRMHAIATGFSRFSWAIRKKDPIGTLGLDVYSHRERRTLMYWRGRTVKKRTHNHLYAFCAETEKSFHFSLTRRKPSIKATEGMKHNACRLRFESFNHILDVQEKQAKAFRRITSDERYERFEVSSHAGLLFLMGSARLVQALVAAELAEPVAERATVDRRAG